MASAFPSITLTVTSSGLTTATTAYSIGDVLGALNTVDPGQSAATLVNITFSDVSDVMGAHDLYFFKTSVTFGTDNAAPSISDADCLKCIGKVSFPTPDDLGGCRAIDVDSIAKIMAAATGTQLWFAAVTQTANAVFGATTALQWIFEYALGA